MRQRQEGRGRGGSALETSVLHKVVRHVQSAAPRFQAILAAHSCKSRVFEVVDYFVCQHCARNNVYIKGYPVFAQYKAMSALYTKAHFGPTPTKRGGGHTHPAGAVLTVAGYDMSLAQAHFLWWMVMHDIDAHLLPRFDGMEDEMAQFKRDMARKYRLRQRAKRMREEGGEELALGKTATQYAKQVQPVLVGNGNGRGRPGKKKCHRTVSA